MDAVFMSAPTPVKQNRSVWELLREMNERFDEAGIIIGNGEIEGMTEADARRKVKEYAETVTRIGPDEEMAIAYFNIIDEEIYVLNPIKMALLLGMYEEAIQMLNNPNMREMTIGEFVQCEDIRITPVPYGMVNDYGREIRDRALLSGVCTSPDEINNLMIWNHDDEVLLLGLMLSDEKLPDELIKMIFDRFYDYMDMDIKRNCKQVSDFTLGKVSPKFMMHILEVTEDKDYEEELWGYSVITELKMIYSLGWGNSDNDTKYSSKNKKQDINEFKCKLQIQLDLIRRYLDKGEIAKALRYATEMTVIYGKGKGYITEYDMENLIHPEVSYEQIKSLIRQRGMLLNASRSADRVYETLYVSMAHDMATIIRAFDWIKLYPGDIHNNSNKEAEIPKWEKLLDGYDAMLKNNTPQKWNPKRAFNIYRSVGGMFLGDAQIDHIQALIILSEVAGMDFETQFSEGFCEWLNSCLHYISINSSPVFNSSNDSWKPYPIENAIDVDIHKGRSEAIELVSEALSRIREVSGSPSGSRSCLEAFLKAVKEILTIDSEEVIWCLADNRILGKEGLGMGIVQAVEMGNIRLVPLMMALRG